MVPPVARMLDRLDEALEARNYKWYQMMRKRKPTDDHA